MESLFIQTSRVQIRNLKEADLEPFYVYRSNPEVTKYQGFEVMTKEEARNFILEQMNKLFGEPGEWVQYGIEHQLTATLIGDCAIKLNSDEPRIAEVGITISPLHQKQGYAKEALTGILHFLFAVKGLHRVVETVDVQNIASVNLLKSLSFRQEGHFIKNIFFKGYWGSEYQFAMLKEEWDLLSPKYFA